MDQIMKGSSKVPMFDGNDYAFQCIRMKNYLMSLRLDVCTFVLEGYQVPDNIPADDEGKKKFWNHAKALNTLQSSLNKKVLAKVLNCKNDKDLWQKLETIYVGDSKVKKEKLQTLRVQYEGLKIKKRISLNTLKGLMKLSMLFEGWERLQKTYIQLIKC